MEAEKATTSASVRCTNEQMAQWITKKVGGGKYLEALVRELVACVGEMSPVGEDRRIAADLLLQLDSIAPILFSAESLTTYRKLPEGLSPDETRAFKYEQLHLWMKLNRLQAPLYFADSEPSDIVTPWLVTFASYRGIEDLETEARTYWTQHGGGADNGHRHYSSSVRGT
jgi:hypothetical protein